MSDTIENQTASEKKSVTSILHLGLWSILLTPIFGAYIVKLNWQVIGKREEVKREDKWLTILLAVYVIIALFFRSCLNWFLPLIIWAVVELRKYWMYLKGNKESIEERPIKPNELVGLIVNALRDAFVFWKETPKIVKDKYAAIKTDGVKKAMQPKDWGVCGGIVVAAILIFSMGQLPFCGVASTSSIKISSSDPYEIIEEFQEKMNNFYQEWLKNDEYKLKSSQDELKDIIASLRLAVDVDRKKGKSNSEIARVLKPYLEEQFKKIKEGTELMASLTSSFITEDDIKNGDPITALVKCAHNNDFENVKYVLEKRKVDVDAEYNHMTALAEAVEQDNKDIVKYLLKKGADPNHICNQTPVLFFCQSEDVLELLIDYKVDKALRYGGKNFLSYYLYRRKVNFEMAKAIIDNDFEIDQQQTIGETPLGVCITKIKDYSIQPKQADYANEYLEIFRYLLKKGVDPNIKENSYAALTCLQLVLLHSKYSAHVQQMVELLVDAKADVNVKDERGNTLLHTLVKGNSNINAEIRNNIVKILIKKLENIDAKNNEGQTPIQLAVMYRDVDLLSILLKSGAKFNYDPSLLDLISCRTEDNDLSFKIIDLLCNVKIDTTNSNIVYCAAIQKNLEMLDKLIQKNICMDDAWKALLKWGANIDMKVVVKIVEGGANVNYKFNEHGKETPLLLFFLNNCPQGQLSPEAKQFVCYLLDHKADANSCSSDGIYLLQSLYAHKSLDKEIFEKLIANKVNLNIPINANMDSLIFDCDIEILKLLLENGADPNFKNKMNQTALTKLVRIATRTVRIKNKNGEFVTPPMLPDFRQKIELLLKYKADPEYCGNENNTLLLSAIYCDNLEMTELLLKGGANPNNSDQKKENFPLIVAVKEKKSLQIVRLLLDFKANVSLQDPSGKKAADYTDNTEILQLLNKGK